MVGGRLPPRCVCRLSVCLSVGLSVGWSATCPAPRRAPIARSVLTPYTYTSMYTRTRTHEHTHTHTHTRTHTHTHTHTQVGKNVFRVAAGAYHSLFVTGCQELASPCSGHGECDVLNNCVCAAGYRGPICGDECPGGVGNACSLRGDCIIPKGAPPFCICYDGYSGADCSIECPGGALNPCSGPCLGVRGCDCTRVNACIRVCMHVCMHECPGDSQPWLRSMLGGGDVCVCMLSLIHI